VSADARSFRGLATVDDSQLARPAHNHQPQVSCGSSPDVLRIFYFGFMPEVPDIEWELKRLEGHVFASVAYRWLSEHEQMLADPTGVCLAVQIAEEHVHEPLRAAENNFLHEFGSVASRFRARCLLVTMLQQHHMMSLPGRICACYLIACSYSWEQLDAFPFLKAFVQVCPSMHTHTARAAPAHRIACADFGLMHRGMVSPC
jgi:hypothetical protein